MTNTAKKMSKNALKKTFLLLSLATLTACGSPNTQTPSAASEPAKTTTQDLAKPTQDETATLPKVGADGKIHLDVALFDTGVAQAELTNYHYPFAIDSVPVQNYAQAYQITAQQAQHAMTLAMASPEVLNKVLDGIIGEYLGHSLTDGKDMSLVVYTTDKVNPAEFEYVIADKFGEGLVLPVKVIPTSTANEKPQVDAQALANRMHSSGDGDMNNANNTEQVDKADGEK